MDFALQEDGQLSFRFQPAAQPASQHSKSLLDLLSASPPVVKASSSPAPSPPVASSLLDVLRASSSSSSSSSPNASPQPLSPLPVATNTAEQPQSFTPFSTQSESISRTNQELQSWSMDVDAFLRDGEPLPPPSFKLPSNTVTLMTRSERFHVGQLVHADHRLIAYVKDKKIRLIQQCDGVFNLLKVHTASILDLALCPAPSLLASAIGNTAPENGGNGGEETAISFLCSIGEDGMLVLTEVRELLEEGDIGSMTTVRLRIHIKNALLRRCIWHSDGQYLAFSAGSQVYLLHVPTVLGQLPAASSGAAAPSIDLQALADMKEGVCLLWSAEQSPVSALSFSPASHTPGARRSDELLYVGLVNGLVHMFTMEGLHRHTLLASRGAAITCILPTASGLLTAASQNTQIRFWKCITPHTYECTGGLDLCAGQGSLSSAILLLEEATRKLVIWPAGYKQALLVHMAPSFADCEAVGRGIVEESVAFPVLSAAAVQTDEYSWIYVAMTKAIISMHLPSISVDTLWPMDKVATQSPLELFKESDRTESVAAVADMVGAGSDQEKQASMGEQNLADKTVPDEEVSQEPSPSALSSPRASIAVESTREVVSLGDLENKMVAELAAKKPSTLAVAQPPVTTNVIAVEQLDSLVEKALAVKFAKMEQAQKQRERALLESLEKKLQATVVTQIGSSVEKAMSKAQSSWTSTLEKSLAKSMQTTLKKTMQDSIANSSSMQQAIQVAVQASVTDIMQKSFEKTLIPAYQAATKTMFQQIHVAFGQGLDTAFKSVPTALEEWKSSAKSLEAACKQQEAAAMKQQQALAELSKKLDAISAQQQQHLQSVAVPRPPSTVALPAVDLKSMIALDIQHGEFEPAFTKALGSCDMELVRFLLASVPVKNVFVAGSPCPLSPPVLLSLVQQASLDLDVDAGLKFEWIQECLMNLDPRHPLITEHLPRILGAFLDRMRDFALHSTDRTLTKHAAILTHVANSLLAMK